MIKLSKEGLLIGDTLFTDQNFPAGSIYLNSFIINGPTTIPNYDSSKTYVVFQNNKIVQTQINDENFPLSGEYVIVVTSGNVQNYGARNI